MPESMPTLPTPSRIELKDLHLATRIGTYATVEALQQPEEMARFIQWVQTKPAAFFEKSRKSQRLKSRR